MEERRDYGTSGGTMYMGGLSYTSRSDHSSRAVRLSSLQGKTGIERNWMNGREERVTHLNADRAEVRERKSMRLESGERKPSRTVMEESWYEKSMGDD